MKPSDSAEFILSVIPGSRDDERLVFASRSQCEEGKPIVLRRESFSEAVGWFVQSSLELTRQEMVALRSALGGTAPAACQRTRMRAESLGTESPKILSFETATRQRVASA